MKFKFLPMLAGAFLPAMLAAQATMMPASPKVGDMAPDFTLAAATAKGESAEPVKLSSLRGKTVVLAFFPRARTGGCTTQMTTYRNQYESIFGGGKSATLFAISNDSAKVTAKWAADSAFQFTFLADVNNDAAKLYGTAGISRNGRPAGDDRVVFVIGPDGKIATIMRPFFEGDPTAYPALGDAIKAANKKK